ncbi:MAG: hypothetical protein M1818_004924 [Claussenomyces sp. TS43310]|nr:MAG: hypothetical protein M1818_004924 [Claussenomyces sp. TS43310]
MPGCTVKRVSERLVTKTGRIHLDERDALDLAAQLGLPAPRVHEAKAISDHEASLCMDFIQGRTLKDAWPGMSDEEKRDVCAQLREILVTMRSAQTKTGIIGSCSGGVVRDCRRYTEYTGGPFLDEGSFNGFILDLHNIMVKDNKITGLIDWEYAGWYPEYWEYVKFFQRYSDNPDWKDYAEYIFPQTYDDELLLTQAMSYWQFQ